MLPLNPTLSSRTISHPTCREVFFSVYFLLLRMYVSSPNWMATLWRKAARPYSTSSVSDAFFWKMQMDSDSQSYHLSCLESFTLHAGEQEWLYHIDSISGTMGNAVIKGKPGQPKLSVWMVSSSIWVGWKDLRQGRDLRPEDYGLDLRMPSSDRKSLPAERPQFGREATVGCIPQASLLVFLNSKSLTKQHQKAPKGRLLD